MPLSQNEKCRLCAKLTTQQARERHGESGDGCWTDKRCPDIRYSYRNNMERNARRRQRYRDRKSGKASTATSSKLETITNPLKPEELMLDIPPAPYAVIHWYRYREDHRIHALGGELWLNNQRISVFGPVHLLGNSPTQVKTLVLQMLQGFSQTSLKQFGIKLNGFALKRELDPSQCPAFDCPLKSRPIDARTLLDDSQPSTSFMRRE